MGAWVHRCKMLLHTTRLLDGQVSHSFGTALCGICGACGAARGREAETREQQRSWCCGIAANCGDVGLFECLVASSTHWAFTRVHRWRPGL